MKFGSMIREARLRAGLTQAQLADRSGTSQAAISAYERGAKMPAADTLDRLLAACGERLVNESRGRLIRTPGARQLQTLGRQLVDVMELASYLPIRHSPTLGFPGIPSETKPKS